MTQPTPTPDRSGPVWTAAAVARRLGVAPGTLRSWSRRHGIGPAAHAPGMHRRYTTADLAEIDAVRALVGQGMVLSAAAAIVRSRRPSDPSGPAPPVPRIRGIPVTDLAAAAARLDPGTATSVVAAGLAEHGVVATWDHLCRPAFAELDAATARDPGCTDAQLLLSWVVASCLRRPAAAPAREARPVLLACAVREQHSLPLEALSAALTELRVPTTMLGPAVPAAGLLHAAGQLRPTTVVVWSQRAVTAAPALLDRLQPLTDAVVAAGPGWHGTAVPPTVSTVADLRTALALTTHGYDT